MAFTYLTLNILFFGAVLVLLRRFLPRISTVWLITLGLLLVLTVVFDNVALWLGFFWYAPQKILHIMLDHAPIEDFFYAVLACLIVPALWHYFDPDRPSRRKRP